METTEQLKVFVKFLEINYHAELLEQVRKGEKFLYVDYEKFASHNPVLSDLLLEKPDDVLKIGEMAVQEFDVEGDLSHFAIRFKNLPESQKIMIRNVRSNHIGKFITTLGVVRQKSDVRPQVTASRFECPSCGNIIPVLQLDEKLKEPSRCGCGRKGKFRLLSKELVDAQGIVLEEATEELEGGGQPKRMNVFLKNDLVSPMSEKKTNPGQKINLNGVIKEVPIILKSGAQSTRFDLLIEANMIETIEEEYSDIVISDEELEEIKKLSEDPKVYSKLVNSVAPGIYGYPEIKEGLIYQMVGGLRKTRQEGSGNITRGDIHVLLCGDPGAGKCLSGDSLITLEDGCKIQIKDLKNDKRKIICFDENLKLIKSNKTHFFKRNVKELLKITLKNKKCIKLTPEHPLLTNNGWISADLLSIGKKIASYSKNKLNSQIIKTNNIGNQKLIQIISTNILWDNIISIERMKGNFTVYDITVPKYHNFIANGVVVHNSQLLKRIQKVAPKSRYVSGKGVSGAGLCVAPTSMVLTNPGGMESIEPLVEKRLNSQNEFVPGVWKQDNITDVKIQSLNGNLNLQSQHPQSIWRLKAPKYVYEVILSSGKKIELTANTQLFSINNGKTSWKKSKNIKEGDYIATPRNLISGEKSKECIVDLFQSNPVIHNVKDFVKKINKKLTKKYGTLRKAATYLKLSENSLYHNWVNPNVRGNIKLKTLKRLAENVNIPWKHTVKTVSLYNGKNHTIPFTLNKDLLYLAGLIAGDGDVRKSNATYSVRLSNSNPTLHSEFRKFLKEEFDLSFDIQKGSKARPESTRTHSKILGEILMSLGIPLSPKSNKIIFSNILLHLENDLIAEYIAGLYDADSSIYIRKSKGSNGIELTTCSEKLARQLQLVFLRYGIHAQIRKRPPSFGKIKGKHSKWIVSFSDSTNFKLFAKNFTLRHPEKREKLKELVKKSQKANTNIDIIPCINNKLKKELQNKKVNLHKIGFHYYHNLSRNRLQKILSKIKCDTPSLMNLKKLANSDVFWEKVKSVKKKIAPYDYVYDLTVKNSHNFVVDGILVHNTAAVVKDEFLQGWSLEAGALVLANKGQIMIDELDKMSTEDRSAMHEALEQQCYHYDFEIMFADGKTEKIGDFVDTLMEENKENKIEGVNCEILEADNLPKVLTTDFQNINPINIDRISRHKSPNHFIKITYSNGRSITVTPEHPIFIEKKGKITTQRADSLSVGFLAPAPRKLPIFNEIQNKQKIVEKGLFLGLFCSEGHSYKNDKYYHAEIGISSTNPKIVSLAQESMKSLFYKDPNLNIQLAANREKATKDLYTVRIGSKQQYQLLQKDTPEILFKAPYKRIPQIIKSGSLLIKLTFLQGYFLGDGFVDQERAGFVTSSNMMAQDLHQLLLNFNIYSYIETEKRTTKEYYKVIVSGADSYKNFNNIVLSIDKRKNRIEKILKRSYTKNNDRDVIPHSYIKELKNILKMFKIDDGYFYSIIKKHQNAHRKTCLNYLKKIEIKLNKATDILLSKDPKKIRKIWCIEVDSISNEMGVSNATIYNFENKTHKSHPKLLKSILQIAERKKLEAIFKIKKLHKILRGDIRFVRIKKIQKIPNKNQKWTYDITIEPTHNFISQNLVLHNSVSISKANVQATLRAETTVLAAANPKFGRFDPYQTIAEQIDLPPTLINRFDLIFPIKDLPDSKKDDHMASFILNLHQNPDIEEADIDTDLFRKYIAYARQNIHPQLTDSAIKEIKDYYLKMRASGSTESGIKSIPISARQLEGLVRLSEAVAKTRLSDKISKKDAKRAINLLNFCLRQIAFDEETGTIDIDRIATNMPASQRGKIVGVREIISELEGKLGKTIPMDDIVSLAKEKGLSEDEVDEAIGKLKRSGNIFEPRPGIISRI